jgi:hypothetical protein
MTTKDKVQHAPGPWQRSNGRIVDATGRQVRVNGVALPSGVDPREEETAANTDLITASAELLEALELAQRWLANCVPTTAIPGPNPLPIISAAIAKARGESVTNSSGTLPTEPNECPSCFGYGHFDDNGEPSIDKRDRKCLDCRGTGKC